MNIIVHLPSEDKQKEIQKEIIEIQATIIMSKLNELKIPKSDKKKVLKELKNNS